VLRVCVTRYLRWEITTMTPAEAKQIIEVLAGGIDPATGEVLPDDSPLSNPHVIRALFIAAKALEPTPAKSARPAAAAPGNAGKSWTEEEDQRLVAGFDAGTPVAALARAPTSAPRVPSTRAWSSLAGCRPATRARLPERPGLTAAGLPCGVSRRVALHRTARAYCSPSASRPSRLRGAAKAAALTRSPPAHAHGREQPTASG
jgi:hypothetical protein